MNKQEREMLNGKIIEKIRENKKELDFLLSLYSLCEHDAPPIIYHYTKLSTLEKIIKNNEFWATHLLYMNDSQELKYGLSLFESYIHEGELQIYEKRGINVSNQREGDDGFVQEVNIRKFAEKNDKSQWTALRYFREYINAYEEFLASSEKSTQCYATCFSMNGDQLSQWRAYGIRGCSIGFNTIQLKNSFEEEKELVSPKPSMTKFLKIIYDRQQQVSIVYKFMNSLVETFNSIINDNDIKLLSSQKIFEKTDAIEQNLEQRVLFWILQENFETFDKILCSLKHPSFKEEDEIRMAHIYYPQNENDLNPPGTSVRLGDYFIPYYKFSLDDKLPIKTIYLSPEYSRNFNEVAYGIKILLKENGYDYKSIEIKPSQSPYSPT